jgi:hypothetical protein
MGELVLAGWGLQTIMPTIRTVQTDSWPQDAQEAHNALESLLLSISLSKHVTNQITLVWLGKAATWRAASCLNSSETNSDS